MDVGELAYVLAWPDDQLAAAEVALAIADEPGVRSDDEARNIGEERLAADVIELRLHRRRYFGRE